MKEELQKIYAQIKELRDTTPIVVQRQHFDATLRDIEHLLACPDIDALINAASTMVAEMKRDGFWNAKKDAAQKLEDEIRKWAGRTNQ